MPSSSRRRHRRRGRNKPPSPAPHPEAEAAARNVAELPLDEPSAVLQKLDPVPRPNLPNPNPPEPQPHSTTRSSSSRRRRGRRGRKAPSPAVVEARDWAELPLDVILAVLHKLDHVEILTGAGQACRSWRRAARDVPALWRRIDMRGHAADIHEYRLCGMSQVAVRRSAGQCEAFWGEYAANEELILLLRDQWDSDSPNIDSNILCTEEDCITRQTKHKDIRKIIALLPIDVANVNRVVDTITNYFRQRAPSLKSLRLISCHDVLFEGLVEAIKKFPLLEELELSLCSNIGGGNHMFEIGIACPQLRHFRLNKLRFYNFKDREDEDGVEDSDNEFKYDKDDDAKGIATMHELRSLQLFGDNLSSEGLTAILDNCSHLESLDIRHCFNVIMNDDLREKCSRIKTLRLPNDSTDDYTVECLSPIWPGLGLGTDSDSDDCVYGGPDYILDSDEYDDYCDPERYLDGVYIGRRVTIMDLLNAEF